MFVHTTAPMQQQSSLHHILADEINADLNEINDLNADINADAATTTTASTTTKEKLRAEAIKLPRNASLPSVFARPRATRFRIVAGSLYWISKAKKSHKARVGLDDITRVMEGQQTKQFAKYKSKFVHEDQSRSLSLVYHGKRGEEALDLVFPDDEEYNRFKEVLMQEVEKAATLFKDPEARYLRRLWVKADVNLDGSLSRDEIQGLVEALNTSLDKRYVDRTFNEIDVNGSGSLDFDEFFVFMRRLRQRPELKGLWSSLLLVKDGGEEGVLSPGRKTPRSTSTRKEGEEEDDQQYLGKLLPLEAFHKFLVEIQGEGTNFTLADAKALLKDIDPANKGEAISFYPFSTYLNDDKNDALDPAKVNEVYQDMTQPLSHYYIASSHNTYLEGDQLNSASSVNRYINDLMLGCRCVELDCWDGDAGEPMVYHGHTLTGRILFQDIIQAVAEYGFKASPYPVILSLENHCSIEQQQKMAGYLTQYLGDKIVMPPSVPGVSGDVIESPQEMKGMFIIKAKRLPATPEAEAGEGEGGNNNGEDDGMEPATPLTDGDAAQDEEDSDDDGGDDDFDESYEGVPHPTPSTTMIRRVSSDTSTDGPEVVAAIITGTAAVTLSGPSSSTAEEAAAVPTTVVKTNSGTSLSFLKRLSSSLLGASSSSSNLKDDIKQKKAKKPKRKKVKVAPELSALAWMPGGHFEGWDASQDPRSCAAYSEPKMEKKLAKYPEQWVALNKRMHSRIYPGGMRIDSSNYNPVGPWTVGSQIVALNFQTPGLPMQLYRGKFQENGNCGYLLKPLALRDPALRFHPVEGPFPSPVTLTLTVISAQQLPKPGSAKGEVIDPYVYLQLFGVPGDVKTETTRCVDDNGFNPCWNQAFTFEMKAPEHALLSFTVYDHDVGNKDDFIATAVLPLTCLRPGFRKVPLCSFASTRGADFEFSSLFVFVHLS